MKKLVLFAVAVVAISFASCGGNKVDPQVEKQRIEDSIKAATEAEAAKLQEQALQDSLAKVQAEADSIAAAAKK
ncbi:regulator of protease activity HflC (stomatin/prohibitin superfamily) [Dysgonomonas sp. PFB1-18]|uniref:hypothetical protein n=1 Tax=unclassified Dysgonomonas TaxID=2630389 RepID=UPI0024762EEC|nr:MULTISPECIES: hypothetical protein [unclassified Dysgonomonas]MDH6309758.1 regulator of protease activity HflC (stomatin/prohibitin superfamily) [Dysgonomonas sp. PF1-14]MDH6339234.1 regulator of protease activity HflC (stomatin/prohibitin superfamily) [Dysgonomonas sp. PF1-16]MDH6380733.1 regulator of protease activity HflC (stomatin/prohibitin superfamily) [Dysgonomonas sp. PFB1-18]MDH6398229.1 regulator of protease activity HflC (stomatin/prohibitin superfamily) [Dysgonomonas sp. PF1-23]